MADDAGFDEPEMSWSTQDFEQKIGFTGGRYTETNAFFTFLVGLIMATVFFLFLEFVITDSGSDLESCHRMPSKSSLGIAPRCRRNLLGSLGGTDLPQPIQSLSEEQVERQ